MTALGSLGFLAGWRLLLLLPVAALVAAYVVRQRSRQRYALRFSALPVLAAVSPRRPGWRRHLPASLLLLSLVGLVVGLARPSIDVRVPRDRATVVVAIDTSASMEAVDVTPSRIDRAKQAADSFIAQLPPKVEVGLVSFSGSAVVSSLPTTDHVAVRRAVDSLTLGPGTAIGEAVFASLDAIRTVQATGQGEPPAPAAIVLMSDGTTTVGRSADEAAAAARAAGVPVSTIAYGTPDGTVVVEGQTIPVPVDTVSLAALADATGGTAFTAQSGAQLDRVYRDIGRDVGSTTDRREIALWLVGIALLAGLAAAAMSLLWSPRLP